MKAAPSFLVLPSLRSCGALHLLRTRRSGRKGALELSQGRCEGRGGSSGLWCSKNWVLVLSWILPSSVTSGKLPGFSESQFLPSWGQILVPCSGAVRLGTPLAAAPVLQEAFSKSIYRWENETWRDGGTSPASPSLESSLQKEGALRVLIGLLKF